MTGDSDKVIGVVSQGDILRALSAGQNLYTPVNQIIRNSFLHLYEKDLEKALDYRRITIEGIAVTASL